MPATGFARTTSTPPSFRRLPPPPHPTTTARGVGIATAQTSGLTSSAAVATSQSPEAQADLLLRLKHRQDLKNLYAQYNPGEGIQTGVILAASLVICFLYVFYKAKCKRSSDIYEEEVIRRSQFDAKFFSYSQERPGATAVLAAAAAAAFEEQLDGDKSRRRESKAARASAAVGSGVSRRGAKNKKKSGDKRKRGGDGGGGGGGSANPQQTLKHDIKKRQNDAKWYQKRLKEVWHSGKQKTQDWIASHRGTAASGFPDTHQRLCQSNVELQLQPSILTQLLLLDCGGGGGGGGNGCTGCGITASRSASNTPYRQIGGSRRGNSVPSAPAAGPLTVDVDDAAIAAGDLLLNSAPTHCNCSGIGTQQQQPQQQQQQQHLQAAALSPVAEEEACPLLPPPQQQQQQQSSQVCGDDATAHVTAHLAGSADTSFEARALVHSSSLGAVST